MQASVVGLWGQSPGLLASEWLQQHLVAAAHVSACLFRCPFGWQHQLVSGAEQAASRNQAILQPAPARLLLNAIAALRLVLRVPPSHAAPLFPFLRFILHAALVVGTVQHQEVRHACSLTLSHIVPTGCKCHTWLARIVRRWARCNAVHNA